VTVRLIHDPYSLFAGRAAHVQTARQLPGVFQEIDGILSASESGTQEDAAYVIDGALWTHFASYRYMDGVKVEEHRPRRLLAERFRVQPDDWLTDDLIIRTGLLDCGFDKLVDGKWEETLVEWLLPRGREAKTLADWMRCACDAPRMEIAGIPDQVRQLLWQQFAARAESLPQWHELQALYSLWADYRTPKDFVKDALLASALKPFQSADAESVFCSCDRPRNAGRLSEIPLVFPLPRRLHQQVSGQFVDAMRKARLENRDLTKTVLSLNAVWYGVPDELRRWLNAHPNALAERAAEHLEMLPGSDAPGFLELLDRFRPHRKPAEWESLEGIETWITEYSAFIRSAFCRRALPETWATDPAAGFSRWITQNITVSFNHQDYGFSYVAHQVRQHLRQGRSVILVLIDAFAYHLHDVLLSKMAAWLLEPPGSVRPIFVPIPTLTEVSKTSILTGLRPDQCVGRLDALLAQVYQLEPQQVLLVDSWNDPSRAILAPSHRLLVYRENGLDDRLGDVGSYTDLLDEFGRLSEKVAERVCGWAKDFRYLTQTDPIVAVTGDHGFTYGPPPAPRGQTAAALGGQLRCVAAENGTAAAHPKGSVAYLGKDDFFLSKSYIAATSRKFGHGTISGWAMQHGGLLPEEVIVPVAMWFTGEGYVAHPAITIVDGALRRAGTWEIALEVQNESSAPMSNVHISVSMPEGDAEWSKTIVMLAPRQKYSATVALKGPDLPESQSLAIRVATRVMEKPGHFSEPRVLNFLVKRKSQLLERTSEQEQFEGLF